MTTAGPKTAQADRLYQRLMEMVVSFALRPGERINEVQLAQKLGASRTPLREALNRLAAERLILWSPGKGYSCRLIKPAEVCDLYQARSAIECYAVELIVAQASHASIRSLTQFLDRLDPLAKTCSRAELLLYDENFHRRLVDASGNRELSSMLENLAARIRYVRWIQMDKPDARDTARHRALLAPIAARDAAAARAAMAAHIETRLDEITEAVGKAHIRLFVDEAAAIPPPYKLEALP